MKILPLLFVLLAVPLSAETFRGVGIARDHDIEESIEVVLTYDRVQSTLKKEDDDWPHYRAKIAIRLTPGKGEFREFDFVVTQFPDKEWSLIGYFLFPNMAGSVPLVLRADTWERGKQFLLFDPSSGPRIYKGKFE